jgi:hypothetical protein
MGAPSLHPSNCGRRGPNITTLFPPLRPRANPQRLRYRQRNNHPRQTNLPHHSSGLAAALLAAIYCFGYDAFCKLDLLSSDWLLCSLTNFDDRSTLFVRLRYQTERSCWIVIRRLGLLTRRSRRSGCRGLSWGVGGIGGVLLSFCTLGCC